jgi:ATP-dependent helicase/DNAse subunit B
VSLSLVLGPAHAGKVALLLDRVVERLGDEPWLIVPTRADVDSIERELLARTGALLAGTIGTFDTLFEHLAYADGLGRRVLGDTERLVLLRRVAATPRGANGPASARFPGYADVLGRSLAELDDALLEPEQLAGDLAELARGYRAQLDAIGAWDRGTLRRRAIERLRGDLTAWGQAPVLAYGFEDLTGAEWALLEALAARTEVHVSVPYEPARPAYAALARTVDELSALAHGRIVELPPAAERHLPAGLAHLERALFSDRPAQRRLDGSVRFLEGAGQRGTLELVAEEILGLVRAGTAADEIAVVCPSVDALRVSIVSAFETLGVPLALESRSPLRTSAFGASLVSLLRFAWLGGDRADLFSHLRSRYSGLARRDVDWVEGKLRGRAVVDGARTLEVTAELRSGRTLPTYDLAVGGDDPIMAVRELAQQMLRNAYGTSSPPLAARARRDLRAHDAVARALDELDGLAKAGIAVARPDVVAALERVTVRGDGAREPGRVAVLDLGRVRTRRFGVVFMLGLEQGLLPRRERPSPFLPEELRAELDERHATRLRRPDSASRDRYLFLTACTRPTRRLVLVRQAVGDEGTPREASPFWDAVRELYDTDDVRRATVRRPLSALTWDLEAAPTERERLRALARIAATDPDDARGIAAANGWDRRLRRAHQAFRRPTRITSPAALAVLGSRDAYAVSDLERMAGCSAAWFVERHLRPGDIDREVDAMTRGLILHSSLQRFYAQLPAAVPGAERVTAENVEDAVRLVHRCLGEALATGLRLDVDELVRRELERGLQRDLERLVRDEAVAPSPFVPRRLEHSFRDYELAPGIVVSGKIDRVDADPWSARGIVVDYKSGAATPAAEILRGEKLQVPLYLLVLRDQIGLEPMGGVYVPVGGGRERRGLLRAGDDRVPGFKDADYVDAKTFAEALDAARETAVGLVERIRTGDVRHDPAGSECPHWCDLWRVCRLPRA